MERENRIQAAVSFRCPRYDQIPDMELYLDQVLSYLNSTLSPVAGEKCTGAMISNYVKNRTMPSPVRKKYTRDHMAYLIVTTLLKQVFTLQQIARFFEIQRETYPLPVAYDYFCTEYENAVRAAFEFTGEAMPRVETKKTEQTILVRAVVLAAVNRVYAEKVYF